MPTHFTATLRKLNSLVDEELEVSLLTSDRSTQGDIETVAQLENLDQNSERYDTTQTTMQIVNNDGEIYAEAIIHTLDIDPTVALLDWVEVIDHENRGFGVGRTIHEEAVEYIESTLEATTIYTKIENPKMQTVNLDTGFYQVDAPNKDAWYRRD